MKEAEELFDGYATSYDEALSKALEPSGEDRKYFVEERVKWLRRCLDELKEAPSTLLDFGCGDGTTTPVLLKTIGAASAIGLDVSMKAICEARKKFQSSQIQFDSVSNYPPEGNVGLAYCNGVFHHIPAHQHAAAVSVVHGALHPGGLLSFWENSPWSPATRYVMSRCAFDRDAVMLTPPEARRLLRAGGFEILRTDFRFVFPHALRALRPLEDVVYRLPLGAQYQVLCRRVA